MFHNGTNNMKRSGDQTEILDSLQGYLLNKNDSNNNVRPLNTGTLGSRMNIGNNTLTIGRANDLKRPEKPRLTLNSNRRRQMIQPEIGIRSETKSPTSPKASGLVTSEPYQTPKDANCANRRAKKSVQLELGLHEARFAEDLVLLDLSTVRGLQDGDLAELKTYKGKNGTGKDKKIYFIVKDFSSELRQRYKNPQISILSGPLQQLIGLPTRSKVWIKAKDKDRFQADVVELNIKDCLVHRGDMWVFSSKLTGSCIFAEQKLTFMDSIRATVKEIFRDGKKVLSGYIGEKTKVVFRSESARLVFMIQITDEMWHFEENGEIFFYKVVNSLFPTIFKKWKDIGTHHTITIVFTASLDLSETPFVDIPDGERPKNTKDYYRVVVDQVNIVHWTEIMMTLRREFKTIARDLKTTNTDDGNSVIRGRFCPAIKSNILETICLATTFLTNPFRQPDLRRTTAHAIIISPGTCIYDVNYDLLKATSKKVQSIELSLDVICLSRPPLHVVPLLRYRDYENRLKYCAPSWMNISFWRYSSYSNDTWSPRCKMHDLQMMGLTETEMKEEIAIDYMTSSSTVKSVTDLMKQYDHDAFTDQKVRRGKHQRTSFSSDFVNDSRPEYTKSAPQNPAKLSLAWNPPKSASPMVQPTATLQVFGDLAKSTNDDEDPEEPDSRIRKSDGEEKAERRSLAVNQLRNVTKSNNIAQRIVSRFRTDFERKSRRDTDIIPVRSAPQSQLSRTDLDFESDNLTVTSFGRGPIIKRNLASIHKPLATKGPLNTNISSMQSLSGSPQRHPKEFLTKVSKKDTLEDATANLFSWLEIKNPSIAMSSELASTFIAPQYKDVFPQFVAKKYSKWRSLTTPAELPITISSFPSKEDFEKNFIFTNHSVILNPDQEVKNQTAFDLLRDMIYVRLLAGFQICIGDGVEKMESIKSNEGDGRKIAKNLTKGNYMDVKFWMMFSEEIHKLSCDYDGSINVQRHVRKDYNNTGNGVPTYDPQIKTRYESSYRETMTDPLKMHRERYNWNQLDQMLAGYEDAVIEKNKKQFRAKFVVLPSDVPQNTHSSTINGRSETLNAEEIRLEGLRRLISSVYRSRLKPADYKHQAISRKEEIAPEILFYTGSLFNFIEEHAEILKVSEAHQPENTSQDGGTLSKEIDLRWLAYETQFGEHHLRLVNRKWHWKKHYNCFLGSELVNWLIENYYDIDTRDDAVSYGQDLMNQGLFVHVENRHGFLDGHYFYQISSEYLEAKKPATDHGPHNAADVSKVSSNSETNSLNHPGNSERSFEASSDGPLSTEVSKSTVSLSNVITVDADTAKRSYKPEICKVHYDRVHNPNHCFHIRLEWLTATPKLIEELINNWARLCKRYGLKLVEVPWVELCTIPLSNPFHTFVDITLAIDPWTDSEFNDEQLLAQSPFYYHTYLLEKNGFLIDNRASSLLRKDVSNYEVVYSWGKPKFKYAQYIHSTGAYIAEIRENGNLFLAPNNRHLSRVNVDSVTLKAKQTPKFALDAEKIMLVFKKTCLDHDKLRAIFHEAQKSWMNGTNASGQLTGSVETLVRA
ncbi:LADA_0A08218g1_1 [Lachancea dasiensis]|uniref:Vacuolar membrane-associated protein IML1 n=1 Tax=Lachancea dasiensis TaxID=1072105 RepID=A0A1G4IQK4_9SACH|nr:LADA_0A08218g1_1 [Lachancea dasiensis]